MGVVKITNNPKGPVKKSKNGSKPNREPKKIVEKLPKKKKIKTPLNNHMDSFKNSERGVGSVKKGKNALKSVPNKESRKNGDKKQKTKKTQSSHKKDLEGLKDIDPEFYNFLKENDKKLLEFNLFDSENESDYDGIEKTKDKKRKDTKKKNADDNDSGSENSDSEDEKYHKPNTELEVASDESDFEDDDDDDNINSEGVQKVTLNLLRQWQIQLEQPNVSVDIVRKVIQAFSAALASITADASEAPPSAFKVVGAAAFNGVIQLCVLHLQPAILRLVGLNSRSNIPLHKTKKWIKVRSCIRYYLTDLIRLVEQVSSVNILTVLLKHLHQMSGMLASFTTLGKTILKRLIVLWSTGDETVRVLSFLCILKITRSQQVSMLNHVLKAMYLSYVRNSKFVSPNMLPCINFMRRSLVEMFALDVNVSYQHAFLYIRQLAIHLRNAVILKKKDSFQAVYNWQFVNSIRLWSDLLGTTINKQQLQPLIYPLVTITIGVIRLIPTAQYFPLRFHCIQSLIGLAKSTQTTIPILPLILEVLFSNTFNKKHSAVSMRPLPLTCVLRLNKAQLSENGFRDEVIEQVCNLVLEYLSHESASLAFSDLVVPTVITLKKYLKQCKNANYSRKIKQLLDKIQENAHYIEDERRKITFGLKDFEQIQAWETKIANKGTPLSIYYTSWVKTHETKKRRQAAQTDNINDGYDVPSIKRKVKAGNVPIRNENGEVELFPSDSEEDEETKMPMDANNDDEYDDTENSHKNKSKSKKNKLIEKQKKREALRKGGKAVNSQDIEEPVEEDDTEKHVDIVKDLDLNDW